MEHKIDYGFMQLRLLRFYRFLDIVQSGNRPNTYELHRESSVVCNNVIIYNDTL